MGWAIGFDKRYNRDVGYGVPAICDAPRCKEEIDRGLSYICGGDIYGGEYGCGLFFCGSHLFSSNPRGSRDYIERCKACISGYKRPYTPKTDVEEWIFHKLFDPSWEEWRKEVGISPV